jgi:membrane carboxypeptidase/penicillin-binding protein
MRGKILWPLLALLLAALVYAGGVIAEARAATTAIVAAALARYGEELDSADLGEERLAILLAVEDPNFFQHHGFDITTPGAGLTTLTQGLVKHLYFDDFRPGPAKIRQTLIAVFALDAMVPKERQLNLYLNSMYLGQYQGNELRGFAQASRHYFGQSFALIDDHEYLQLVAMIIGPNAFHPENNPGRLEQRVQRIRKLLDDRCAPDGLRDVYYDNCTP